MYVLWRKIGKIKKKKEKEKEKKNIFGEKGRHKRRNYTRNSTRECSGSEIENFKAREKKRWEKRV